MATLGMVLNPTAGKGKAENQGTVVEAILKDRGHEVVDLSAPDLAAAHVSARQAVVDGVDALIVAGGDGMTHLGVNVVAGTTLPLGIVPLGTGNDVARILGLPRHDLETAVQIIEDGLTNGPRVIDAVRVTDTSHSMSEWYAGVLSAGFDAAVNAIANRLTWPRGESVYVRALFQEIKRYKPYGFEIDIDGELAWQSAAALVAVANGSDIGGGMHIAPDAAIDDGLLDVVIGGPVSTATLLTVFPRVYRGTHIRHPAVTILQGHEVTVRARPDLGLTPPDAHTDGERVGPLPLSCRCVPGALRVLAGKP
ncbi:MAG: diacylglycerol kinase family lipid kinase [Bifidobacteriaceae bacterium]|jgi:diacylglycerol kinase (ATP)|nr:diacylglycerol kinase family lipid kinase [Bifidobacteriaceae bacterium]